MSLTHVRRPRHSLLAIALAACFLVAGGVLAGLAAEHGVHHAHHNAATHSTAFCAWMCAAGQVLQGFDLAWYGPSLTLLIVEPWAPSTTDALFPHAPRSRAPPSS